MREAFIDVRGRRIQSKVTNEIEISQKANR